MSGTGKTFSVLTTTGDSLIDGVLSGYAWSGPITFAFPSSSSSYDYSGEKSSGFAAVSQAQIHAARFAIDTSYGSAANDGFSVEGFTNANVSETSSTTSATLRFAQSTLPSTAWAYLPGDYAQAGDIWFGTSYAGTIYDYRAPVAGNYAWHTLMHELGHALGLKHGHETERSFGPLPTQYNSIEYSIMTYRGYIGGYGYTYEQYGAPQTFMMADIAALQEMYGADFTTNSGNTVYQWTPGSGATLVNGAVGIAPGANRIFATIWDGGGNDTFDLTAYTTGLKIDLRPGMASTFSVDQLAWLGGGANNGFAAGNIFNALLYHGDVRSLIENVLGGSGNDTITGNQAANTLLGYAGNDVLNGDPGNDALYGGLGRDKIRGGNGNDRILGGTGLDHLSGGTGADTFVFKTVSESTVASTGRDTIYDFLPSEADIIDLSAIDANAMTRTNNGFSFIGGKEFRGNVGELRYVKEATDTYVYADVNGDKQADFSIHLDVAITMEKGFFVL